MRNVIFFVHGVGRHDLGWSTAVGGPVHVLNEAMKRYACFQGKPLSEFVDIVEICYYDLFDQVLSKWATLAKDLTPVDDNISWIGKVHSLLAAVGGNREEYADYGGDALLYAGFDLVARAVQFRVASVFASEVLRRHLMAQSLREQFPKIGVVAHSLGTAVAHDALWALATTDFLKDTSVLAASRLSGPTTLSDDQRIHFARFAEGTRDHPSRPMPLPIDMLLLVSNLIPLISRVDGDYLSLKSEGVLQCAAFRDVNNRFDPVCNVKRFVIGGRTNGKRIDVDHIHDSNVYGFGHYLSNPLVHMPLLNRMTGVVKSVDIDVARGDVDKNWHGIGDEVEADIQRKLESMLSTGDIEDLQAKFKALKQLTWYLLSERGSLSG